MATFYPHAMHPVFSILSLCLHKILLHNKHNNHIKKTLQVAKRVAATIYEAVSECELNVDVNNSILTSWEFINLF